MKTIITENCKGWDLLILWICNMKYRLYYFYHCFPSVFFKNCTSIHSWNIYEISVINLHVNWGLIKNYLNKFLPVLIKVQTLPNIPVLLHKKLLGKFHWITCIILSLELGFSGSLKITCSPPITLSQRRIYFSCVDSFYLYALEGQSYFQGLFGLPKLFFFSGLQQTALFPSSWCDSFE